MFYTTEYPKRGSGAAGRAGSGYWKGKVEKGEKVSSFTAGCHPEPITRSRAFWCQARGASDWPLASLLAARAGGLPANLVRCEIPLEPPSAPSLASELWRGSGRTACHSTARRPAAPPEFLEPTLVEATREVAQTWVARTLSCRRMRCAAREGVDGERGVVKDRGASMMPSSAQGWRAWCSGLASRPCILSLSAQGRPLRVASTLVGVMHGGREHKDHRSALPPPLCVPARFSSLPRSQVFGSLPFKPFPSIVHTVTARPVHCSSTAFGPFRQSGCSAHCPHLTALFTSRARTRI
jgi:hypothetical protein